MNSKTKTFSLLITLFLLLSGLGKLSAQTFVSIDTKTTYTLTNAFLGSGVALDGVGGNQRPAMRTANASDLQKWQFADLGNGYYRITCVGVPGAALEGGAKDQGALMNGIANQSGQMWRAIDAGNGNVSLVNMFTEKDNYAFEGGALNGGALITAGGHSGQSWKLSPAKPGPLDGLTKLPSVDKLDPSATIVQFKNVATGQFIVLRPDPRGGGALEGGAAPAAKPWYFYQAPAATSGNVEVKQVGFAAFNWSNYDNANDANAFIAWNHAKRLPNNTAPDAPHNWDIVSAGAGIFLIKDRMNKEVMELIPGMVLYIKDSKGPKIITRALVSGNTHQQWEIYVNKVRP